MLTQREMSDRLEITDLLYRYARSIDARDFDLLSTVFTPDASIHYAVPGGLKLRFPELGEWLRLAFQMFRVTQHALANPSITFDGDAARATTYLTAIHVQTRLDGSERCITLHGIYVDRLVQTEAGWRIAERRLDHLYTQGEFSMPDELRKFSQGRPG